MTRFDEIELRGEPEPAPPPTPPARSGRRRKAAPAPEESSSRRTAPIAKRMLAFLTDLSLFAALALALSPLITQRGTIGDTVSREWPALIGLTGFLLLLSLFYFAGCWTIWGRTVGGTIFETAIVDETGGPIELRAATKRWAATLLSLAILGLGFVPALFASHRSLPDRISGSIVVRE